MRYYWPEQRAYRSSGACSFLSLPRAGWKLSPGEARVPYSYDWNVFQNSVIKMGQRDVSCTEAYGVPTEVSNHLGDIALNRSFAKFREEISKVQAQLGSALVEAGSTVSMVNNRLDQLLKGARSLRNGDFKGFLRTFGMTPKPKHRKKQWNKPAEASGLWLEYWMGWAPTVNDVYNGLEVLSREKFSRLVKGRATVVSQSSFDWGRWDNPFDAGRGSYMIRVTCMHQALCSISNPNVARLNDLGLVNPVSVAWQVTPWSWLVGWFVNLEYVFDSWTYAFGLEFKDSFTTRSFHYQGSEERKFAWSWLTTKTSNSRSFGARSLGIKTPVIVLQMPQRLSLTRAATLTSLLTQIGASHASRR